jgi:SAM-dependent methyltransferase
MEQKMSDKNTGVTVLKNWNQVGEAIQFLGRHNHRTHHNPIKSWDLMLIHEMVSDLDRDALVVDLGASVLGAVRLFHEMGFRRICGYDLAFTKFDRLIQIRDWIDLITQKRRRLTLPPYRLFTKGLFETGLPRQSVSALICLSVIEHGINQDLLFAEAARLLRPGGHLFVSTDYWEPKLDTTGRKMFGQPWTIFSRKEIESLLTIAENNGLAIYPGGLYDLSCEDAIVHDLDHSYTFIAMRLRKM